MCVCSFFAELLCWWLSFFQFFISSKQRRKTWLAAQVAARHSTNTSGAGSVENDGSDHVVTVDQEAPSPVVDVRSNFQVGEMMRFQHQNNTTVGRGMSFCYGWRVIHSIGQVLGIRWLQPDVRADLMMFHFLITMTTICFRPGWLYHQSVSIVCYFFNDQLARWFWNVFGFVVSGTQKMMLQFDEQNNQTNRNCQLVFTLGVFNVFVCTPRLSKIHHNVPNFRVGVLFYWYSLTSSAPWDGDWNWSDVHIIVYSEWIHQCALPKFEKSHPSYHSKRKSSMLGGETIPTGVWKEGFDWSTLPEMIHCSKTVRHGNPNYREVSMRQGPIEPCQRKYGEENLYFDWLQFDQGYLELPWSDVTTTCFVGTRSVIIENAASSFPAISVSGQAWEWQRRWVLAKLWWSFFTRADASEYTGVQEFLPKILGAHNFCRVSVEKQWNKIFGMAEQDTFEPQKWWNWKQNTGFSISKRWLYPRLVLIF